MRKQKPPCTCKVWESKWNPGYTWTTYNRNCLQHALNSYPRALKVYRDWDVHDLTIEAIASKHRLQVPTVRYIVASFKGYRYPWHKYAGPSLHLTNRPACIDKRIVDCTPQEIGYRWAWVRQETEERRLSHIKHGSNSREEIEVAATRMLCSGVYPSTHHSDFDLQGLFDQQDSNDWLFNEPLYGMPYHHRQAKAKGASK